MIQIATVFDDDSVARHLVERWVNAEDRAASGKRQQSVAQRRTLLARAALRAVLFSTTGSSDWLIRPNADGKPEAWSLEGIRGPHISLSHTKGLVACAVSTNGPLGIDVEHWRMREYEKLSSYAFGPKESAEVASEGVAAFYRIWTLREAIAKTSGRGIFSMIDGSDYAANSLASGFLGQ